MNKARNNEWRAHRDQWLSSDDKRLLNDCRLEHYKGTGRGGQKRNKTSSAVRLTHEPTGLAVTGEGSRQQSVNLRQALRGLRLRLALELRIPYEGGSGIESINPKNPMFPLWAARTLDLWASQNYNPKDVAEFLGVTSSQVVKSLYKHPELWIEVNRKRESMGMNSLRRP